jgi:hypothetical protein
LWEIAVTRFCRLSFVGLVVGSFALLPACHTRLASKDTNVTFTEQCSQSDFAEIDPGRAITATIHASRKGTCAKVKTCNYPTREVNSDSLAIARCRAEVKKEE